MTDTTKKQNQEYGRRSATAFAQAVAGIAPDRREAFLQRTGISATVIDGDLGTIVVVPLNQRLPGVTICE